MRLNLTQRHETAGKNHGRSEVSVLEVEDGEGEGEEHDGSPVGEERDGALGPGWVHDTDHVHHWPPGVPDTALEHGEQWEDCQNPPPPTIHCSLLTRVWWQQRSLLWCLHHDQCSQCSLLRCQCQTDHCSPISQTQTHWTHVTHFMLGNKNMRLVLFLQHWNILYEKMCQFLFRLFSISLRFNFRSCDLDLWSSPHSQTCCSVSLWCISDAVMMMKVQWGIQRSSWSAERELINLFTHTLWNDSYMSW